MSPNQKPLLSTGAPSKEIPTKVDSKLNTQEMTPLTEADLARVTGGAHPSPGNDQGAPY